MLLRVRTPGGSTLKLRIESNVPYSSVVEQAAREAGLPVDGLSLSLGFSSAFLLLLPALSAAMRALIDDIAAP